MVIMYIYHGEEDANGWGDSLKSFEVSKSYLRHAQCNNRRGSGEVVDVKEEC